MSIAEMITQGTQQQSQNWSVLSQNLSRLGQQVGQQLALREYQKQAAEALPAMQAAYRSAMDDVSRGSVTEGYRKFMDAQFQFGASQNPFVRDAALAAGDIFQNAATMYEKQQQRQAQYGGRGIGGSLPVMTPKAAAESALLGETQGLPVMGGAEMEAVEVDPATGQHIAAQADIVDVDMTQMPGAMEGVGQQDISASLIDIANTAKSAKFKSALTEAAKNPPNEATLQDVKAARDNFFALKEDEQRSMTETYTSKFKNRKEAQSAAGKNFYRIEGADRILGKQYEGIILKPSIESESVTINLKTGQPDRQTFGTDSKNLRNFSQNIDGAISELNQGKIGNFISNSGGAFNVEKETVEEDVEDESGQVKKEQATYLFNKNNPDNRIKIPDAGGSGKGILASLEIIKGIPSELQRINNRGGTASLVAVERPVGRGPTSEAAKELPAKKISPIDQQALDWANANPNDPRSKAIKQKLGI